MQHTISWVFAVTLVGVPVARAENLDPVVVPDVPALTAIGGDASKVERPGGTSDVGAQLATIYVNGEVQSGVGFEVSLKALGVGREWTINDYRASALKRMLLQSAFSVGTAASGEATEMEAGDVRLAIALRVVLFDDTDPLLSVSYVNATEEAQRSCLQADFTARQACKKLVHDNYKAWVPPRWNAGGAFVAGALIERFEGSTLSGHDFDGGRLWGAYGRGFGPYVHVAVGGAWQANVDAEDDASFGLRLRLGSDRFRGAIDGEWFPIKADDADGQIGIGVEFKLASSVWLTTTASTELGIPDQDEVIQLLSSLKWGTSDKPSW